MRKRVFIVMKEDIINYPPALTVIRTLLDLNCKVIHIGRYSDELQKSELKSRDVDFIETDQYNGLTNLISKYFQQQRFKKKVIEILASYKVSKNDYVWLLNAETIVLLGDLAKQYKTIFHYFEFRMPYVNIKYRILNPFFDPYEINKKAYKVVQCEYNRAHIFKAFLHLDTLPIVLPNKPYDKTIDGNDIPEDVKVIVEDIRKRLRNRKAILYQGVFQDNDRKLDEFFDAINELPDEYAFIAMGSDSPSYSKMKNKYESDRILFVPFIRPPYHLHVTKLSHIGILSYVANEDTVAGAINPIYCAPNKIFEYSKFGKPMLSNDLPGLSVIYKIYSCGECIDYPITSTKIRDAILKIDTEYRKYEEGSLNFYKSVDIEAIITEILN